MLASAIIGHAVGDYLLQNDWMAHGKKQSSWICSVHCIIWSACVLLFTGWPIYWLPVLFATHFAQDRTGFVVWYMRIAGQQKFLQPPTGPWSIIVVDNVFHLVALWVIHQLQ